MRQRELLDMVLTAIQPAIIITLGTALIVAIGMRFWYG